MSPSPPSKANKSRPDCQKEMRVISGLCRAVDIIALGAREGRGVD